MTVILYDQAINVLREFKLLIPEIDPYVRLLKRYGYEDEYGNAFVLQTARVEGKNFAIYLIEDEGEE